MQIFVIDETMADEFSRFIDAFTERNEECRIETEEPVKTSAEVELKSPSRTFVYRLASQGDLLTVSSLLEEQLGISSHVSIPSGNHGGYPRISIKAQEVGKLKYSGTTIVLTKPHYLLVHLQAKLSPSDVPTYNLISLTHEELMQVVD